MALTAEQRLQYLKRKGYNSEEVDLTESTDYPGHYELKPKVVLQPSNVTPSSVDTLPPVTQQPPQQTTALGAAGRSALASAAPTAASIAAGIGAPALIGSSVGPLGTLGGIGVGLLSALGAGYATSKLQDKYILSDEFKQQLATGAVEHPVASTFGGFAPSAIAFNPITGLKTLPQVGRAAKDLVTHGRGALTDRSKNLLLNTGVNVGAQAGIDTAQQLSEPGDKPFDYGRLALNTALGGILNEPNKFGRKLGIKGTADIPENHLPPDYLVKQAESILNREKLQSAEIKLAEAARIRAENEKIQNPESDFNPQKSKTIPDDAERLRTMGARYQDAPARDPVTDELLIKNQPEHQRLAEEEAARRGISYRTPSTIETPEGPKLGQYREDVRETQVAQDRGALDTPSHETIGHGFVRDLLKSSDMKDRRLASKGIEIAGGEEELAKVLGKKGYERKLTELKGAKFSDWWKDFSTHFKNKFKLATDEDVLNFISQRGRHDAPYGSRAEFLPKDLTTSPQVGVKYQDNKETKPYDPNWRVMVQQGFDRGDGQMTPSHVQIDYADNTRSTNLRKLAEEGFEIPVTEQEMLKLPSGRYSMKEALEKLKEGGTEGVKYSDESSLKKGARLKSLLETNNKELLRKKLEESDFTREEAVDILTDWNSYKDIVQKRNRPLADEIEKFQQSRAFYQDETSLTPREQDQVALKKVYDTQKGKDTGGIVGKDYQGEFNPFQKHQNKLKEEQISNEKELDLMRSKNNLDDIDEKRLNFLHERQVKIKEELLELEEPYFDQIIKHLTYKEKLLRENGLSVDAKTNKIFYKNEDGTTTEVDIKSFAPEDQKGFQEFFELQRKVLKINPPEKEGESAFSYQSKSSLKPEDAPSKQESYGFARFAEAANDKVRRIDPRVAKGLDEFATDRDIKMGELRNVPLRDIRARNLSDKEMSNALNSIRHKLYGIGDEPKLSPAEKNLVNEILLPLWTKTNKLQKDVGITRYNRFGDEAVFGEYYIPDVLKDKAIDLFTRRAHTTEANIAKREWAEHVNKLSDGKIPVEAALKNIREFTSTLGGNRLFNIDQGSLQKTKSYLIPDSLREQELPKVIGKFGRDVAQDLAYRKRLKNDDYISKKLHLTGTSPTGDDTLISHPDVQNALKFVFNDFNTAKYPKFTAGMRAVSNALLGGPTGVRDLVAVMANTAPYVRSVKDVGAFFKGLSEFSINAEGALRTGARSETLDLDHWHTLESPDSTTAMLNKVAEAFRKYQGRDLLEQTSRIVSFGFGKELAKIRVIEAAAGNKRSQEWLEKFGTLIEDKPYNKYTPEDIDIIAKNFTDRVQGTYDARGLAAGTFEGPMAPFLALSRWSVEKSNVIYKDVVKPLLSGDYVPFLTYTLGTVLTGAAIAELNELMSGKKANNVSLKEAIAENSKEHMVSSVISLMQLGGYAGIISDIARAASDLAIEHETPRGLAFPLVDMLSDTLGAGMQDYLSAVDAGADPFEAGKDFVWDSLKQSIQNVRVLNSRVLDQDTTERQNKFRDLRAFKKTQDEEVPSVASLRSAQRFGYGKEKEFKRTEDLSKAVELLPELLSKAISKASGDPYKLKQELTKLKGNSYQTMPNPETMPLSFVKYIQFLQKTQGPEMARDRLMDYFKMQDINKVKRELVPSL